MPRTIESILACHQAAVELRKAGKNIWKQTIHIKEILVENENDTSANVIADKAHRIAKLIRVNIDSTILDEMHSDCHMELLEAIERLEQCSVESLKAEASNGYLPDDFFDEQLEVIYDWADANRVWIG
jgi:hypothetical protein